MKKLVWLVLVSFLAAGCAHSPAGSSSDRGSLISQETAGEKPKENRAEKNHALSDPASSPPGTGGAASLDADRGNPSLDEENFEEDRGSAMADPLEPFNRVMFQFNDKLYFWLIKPVALGYNKAVPGPARKGVKNFFNNLGFPVRFIGSLLQGDFKGALSELGRFTVNTVWGVGGLLDPSSSPQLAIPTREADLGQTLGVYGVGQGFFLIWPFLGPSSARDSLGMVGDYFLDPLSYISPWYDYLGVKSYQEVNAVSLRIGDYESFLGASIDPYVAMRDAYSQYRLKKVQSGKGKPEPPKPAGVR